jgi:hypothetical protein
MGPNKHFSFSNMTNSKTPVTRKLCSLPLRKGTRINGFIEWLACRSYIISGN